MGVPSFLIWISFALQLLAVGYSCALAIYRTSLETWLLKFFVQPFVSMLFLCVLEGVCVSMWPSENNLSTRYQAHHTWVLTVHTELSHQLCLVNCELLCLTLLWRSFLFFLGDMISLCSPGLSQTPNPCLSPKCWCYRHVPRHLDCRNGPLRCHRIWNSHLILRTHSPC